MINVSFRAHLTKFDWGVLSPLKRSYESTKCVCMLLRSHRNAGSVSSCCVHSLLTTQVCEQRLCLCLLCVAVKCVSQLVSQARCTEEVMGSRWENIPPKKCEFIAASLGHRASGLSLPHDTIISWALSREKYGLKTQRKS